MPQAYLIADENTTEPVREISLDEYLEIVSAIPKPTDEHIEAFVAHVSDAHSWYKHLPILPPGRPFVFFVDWFVGCDRLVFDSGRIACSLRMEDCPGIHWHSLGKFISGPSKAPADLSTYG